MSVRRNGSLSSTYTKSLVTDENMQSMINALGNLSVSHALTADFATNAANATNAVTANHAVTADGLTNPILINGTELDGSTDITIRTGSSLFENNYFGGL